MVGFAKAFAGGVLLLALGQSALAAPLEILPGDTFANNSPRTIDGASTNGGTLINDGILDIAGGSTVGAIG